MSVIRWPWHRGIDLIEASGLRNDPETNVVEKSGGYHAGILLPGQTLFDPVFYRTQTGAGAAQSDPLGHYLRRGWRDGLRPSARFDPAFYARSNPDVRLAGYEPLTHYAARGLWEGREPNGAAAAGLTPTEPTDAEWEDLPSRPAGDGGTVDVVMPVYRGRAETLRAIHRVLAAGSATPVELVVVDDASPDADLVARLTELARRGRITLITQAENRGFVAAANAGMALHTSRDVILLNADVEVFGDWVDRLLAVAGRDRAIGTVTPWSSDATILSYPIRLRPNAMELEASDRTLDAIAAGLPGEPVEIPTAVGSCMFIRRACLAAVGFFDEARFGRGYGEENDFSCRARRAGWSSVAAPTVYVRHYGSRSFGAEKNARIETALATLSRLHPDYLPRVRRFMKTDPLRGCRQMFDEARIRTSAPVQILTTARDGANIGPDAGAITVTPARGPEFGLIDLRSAEVPATPNLPPLDPDAPPAEWRRRLTALNVGSVRTTAQNPTLARFLETVAHRCDLPIERIA